MTVLWLSWNVPILCVTNLQPSISTLLKKMENLCWKRPHHTIVKYRGKWPSKRWMCAILLRGQQWTLQSLKLSLIRSSGSNTFFQSCSCFTGHMWLHDLTCDTSQPSMTSSNKYRARLIHMWAGAKLFWGYFKNSIYYRLRLVTVFHCVLFFSSNIVSSHHLSLVCTLKIFAIFIFSQSRK